MDHLPPLRGDPKKTSTQKTSTAKPKPQAKQEYASLAAQTPSDLGYFIEERFRRWDTNHDGSLGIQEINHQITSPSVKGRDAALLVAVYMRVLAKGVNGLVVNRDDLLKATGNRTFRLVVSRDTEKINTASRELFAPGDPVLSEFHQGRSGDCYLLAVVAAAVNGRPEAIRGMVRPNGKHGYTVTFYNGFRVHLTTITDAELLLASRSEATHGVWLLVLEKAYGIIRRTLDPKRIGDPRAGEPLEIVGSGSSRTAISVFTGRMANSARPSKLSRQELHDLLTFLTSKRRLVCCSTPKGRTMPPGISGHHAYAVLGYDVAHRKVKVFNPHGKDFTPRGTPGQANGYGTDQGVFEIPLADFAATFSSMVYETARPLGT